jgi:hypothetical protein
MKFQFRNSALQLRFQLCFRYHESSPLAQNIDDYSVTDPRQLVSQGLRTRIHFMRISISFHADPHSYYADSHSFHADPHSGFLGLEYCLHFQMYVKNELCFCVIFTAFNCCFDPDPSF